MASRRPAGNIDVLVPRQTRGTLHARPDHRRIRPLPRRPRPGRVGARGRDVHRCGRDRRLGGLIARPGLGRPLHRRRRPRRGRRGGVAPPAGEPARGHTQRHRRLGPARAARRRARRGCEHDRRRLHESRQRRSGPPRQHRRATAARRSRVRSCSRHRATRRRRWTVSPSASSARPRETTRSRSRTDWPRGRAHGFA